MNKRPTKNTVTGTARDARSSKPVTYGARAGLAAAGLVHLLLAWIALNVAWGNSSGSADQSGALGTMANNPGGKAVLWVVGIGLVVLAVWHLAQAVSGHPGADAASRTKDAVTDVAKAIIVSAIAFTAFKFASGGGASSSGSTRDFTSKLMSQPFGRSLVAAIGVGIIAVGVYHVYKGATKGFTDDLAEHPGRAVIRLGQVGYVAKGIALGVVGALFVAGGLHGSTDKTTGLDGALRTLGEQPFGPFLLTLVALGIACYGVFSFAQAKYARL